MADQFDPLVALSSSRSSVRLTAVRAIARTLTDAQVFALKRAKQTEEDTWVKTAIDDALARANSQILPRQPLALQPALEKPPSQEELEKQAVWKVSKTLSHEISPIIGRLNVAAKNEIPKFETSTSKKEIDLLIGFTDVLFKLQEATATPAYKECKASELFNFDLTESEPSIQLAGDLDIILEVDPVLFQLAYYNGVRNALEASKIMNSGNTVIINWGQNEKNYWVSITDSGPGLSEASENYFKFGTTTKERSAHFGAGLYIAQNAMQSLGGNIELKPRDEGGAIFRITWPKAK